MKDNMTDFLIRVERKDLGITHADFKRIYPRVCNGKGVTSEFFESEVLSTVFEPSIALQTIDDQLKIGIFVKVSGERLRQVGSLKFPYVELVFGFSGLTEREIDTFMERFDRAFQKGGG